MSQLDHLLESVINKNEADEGGEAFLSETSEVLHQETGVCGDQHQTEHSGPQPYPQPKLQIVKVIIPEEAEHKHKYMTSKIREYYFNNSY